MLTSSTPGDAASFSGGNVGVFITGSGKRRQRRAVPADARQGGCGVQGCRHVVPGRSPLATLKDLQEYQRYTADLLAAVQTAFKAGRSIDEAAASINLADKYWGYASERVKIAVQDIYDELKASAGPRR